MTTKRFLVIGRVGSESLHHSWINDGNVNRTWDLQLSAYGDKSSQIADADLPTVVDQGTKWDSLARHFRAHPHLLERYEYVMLPDDDVWMTARGINRVFEMVVAHDLSIAQPALSIDSFVSHPMLIRCPGFSLRYTDHVECMCPCIKTSFMKELLPFLEKYPCGWGADQVWALLMEDPAFRAAVLDEVTMTHTRSLYSSALYETFAKQGVDPFEEVEIVTALFENLPKRRAVYGGILKNGKRTGNMHTQLFNGTYLIFAALKSKSPYRIFRKGIGMLACILNEPNYQPVQLRWTEKSKIA